MARMMGLQDSKRISVIFSHFVTVLVYDRRMDGSISFDCIVCSCVHVFMCKKFCMQYFRVAKLINFSESTEDVSTLLHCSGSICAI